MSNDKNPHEAYDLMMNPSSDHANNLDHNEIEGKITRFIQIRHHDRIIVSIILNFLIACTAWGIFAGRITISSSLT